MAVTQYIGARYVPLFADPVDWDNRRSYEPLTIVYYQGNSYTSKQAVPAGIDISNTDFWAVTGNYNAQVEQYRSEVRTYDGRITQNANDISALGSELPSSQFDSTNTVKKYVDDSIAALDTSLDGDIAALGAKLPASQFSDTNTVKKYVDDSISSLNTSLDGDIAALGAKLPATQFSDTNTVKKYVDDSISSLNTSLGGDISSLGASIDKVNNYKGAKIAFIGDSFSDPAFSWGVWVANLASYLGCTIYNYAESGMGFVSRSGFTNTFQNQLTTALTEHDDLTDIIVYGGTNDGPILLEQYDTYANAVNSFFSYIHTNVSDSVNIHVFLANTPNYSSNAPWAMRKVAQSKAMNNGVKIREYPYVNAVQLMYGGFQSASNAHPSDSFATTVLMPYFAESLLCGISVPSNVIWASYGTGFAATADNPAGGIWLVFSGDTLHVDFPEVLQYSIDSGAIHTTGTFKILTWTMATPPSKVAVHNVPVTAYWMDATTGNSHTIIGRFSVADRELIMYVNTELSAYIATATGKINFYMQDITVRLPT